jgi:hypothetical protein
MAKRIVTRGVRAPTPNMLLVTSEPTINAQMRRYYHLGRQETGHFRLNEGMESVRTIQYTPLHLILQDAIKGICDVVQDLRARNGTMATPPCASVTIPRHGELDHVDGI